MTLTKTAEKTKPIPSGWLKIDNTETLDCFFFLIHTARPGHARTLPREETDSSGAARQPLTSQLSSGTVTSSIYQKQLSHRVIRQRSKRQSVARMGWDAVKSLKVGPGFNSQHS